MRDGLSGVGCPCGSRHPDLDFRGAGSREPRRPEDLHTLEPYLDPRIPLQQPIDQTAAGTNDLARQEQELLEKLLELHRQQRLPLFATRLH